PPLPSSSRPSRSPHVTARRRRTSSTPSLFPSTTSSRLPAPCASSPWPALSRVPSRRSSELRSPLDARLTVAPPRISPMTLSLARLRVCVSATSIVGDYVLTHL